MPETKTFHSIPSEGSRAAGITRPVRFTSHGWSMAHQGTHTEAGHAAHLATMLAAIGREIERNGAATCLIVPLPSLLGQPFRRMSVRVRRGSEPMVTVGSVDDLRESHPHMFRTT